MYVAKETGTERSLCIELVLEDIPGGGVVDPDDFKTTTLVMGEGALLGVDSNGILHLTKTAKIQANASSSATDYRVLKGHEFKVGDFVVDSALTGAAYAITGITTTETAYDTITVGTTLGHAVTTADCLVQAVAQASAGAGVYFASPIGIALNAVDLTKDNLGCGLMVRGTVNESLLPYTVDADIKAKLPLVRFI